MRRNRINRLKVLCLVVGRPNEKRKLLNIISLAKSMLCRRLTLEVEDARSTEFEIAVTVPWVHKIVNLTPFD